MLIINGKSMNIKKMWQLKENLKFISYHAHHAQQNPRRYGISREPDHQYSDNIREVNTTCTLAVQIL